MTDAKLFTFIRESPATFLFVVFTYRKDAFWTAACRDTELMLRFLDGKTLRSARIL